MRLDLEDDYEPFEGQTLRRTKNENCVLFHAYWIKRLKERGFFEGVDKALFGECRRQHTFSPGKFWRHPGNMVQREAQDNAVGAASGDIICGSNQTAKDICTVGEQTGWRFDHITPENKDYKIQQVYQPADVAFFKMVAGKVPAVWEWLHFIFAVAITGWYSDPSSTLLADLRIYALRQAKLQEDTQPRIPGPTWRDPLPAFMWAGVQCASLIWLAGTRLRYGFDLRGALAKYFIEGHPIRMLIEFPVVN